MQLDTTDGARLHVRVDGDGPALLLVNSLGSDLTMWDLQLERFASRRTLVRFDVRGHGRSTAGTAVTLPRLTDDIMSVMDVAGLERAAVCGVSLGGMLALQLALDHPERVDALIIANSAARIGTPDAWRDRAHTVREEGLTAISEAVMARFFSERFRREHPATVASFRTIFESNDPAAYAACCDALADADVRTELTRIVAPTLIIAGADDEATPPQQARELQMAIDDAELVTLPAGHLSNVEQPVRFSKAVEEFLDDTA